MTSYLPRSDPGSADRMARENDMPLGNERRRRRDEEESMMRDSVERPASTRPSTRCGPGARTSSWSGGCTIWAGPGGGSGPGGCSSSSGGMRRRHCPRTWSQWAAPNDKNLAAWPGREARALPGPAPVSRVRAADQAGPRHPGRPHRGGAPHFRRLDGGPQEPVPEETTVEERPNGPLLVRGNVTIFGQDHTLVRQDTRVALCRCGASANKPFCDGSHRRVGLRTG